MTFVSRLNYKEAGHLITDELFTLTSDKVYVLKHHNLINNAQLEVWTGVGKTGTQITNFTIEQDTTKLWVSKVIFDASVANGDYYVTYYSQGDRNDADDLNSLYAEIPKGKLVRRYVYSGNAVIQPTSVDLVTGIFTTTDPIGLTAGSKRLVMPVLNEQKTGQLPREWNGIDAHSIEVIDDYNFYVLQGSQTSTTRMTYPNVANTAVDPLSFHFEHTFPNWSIDLSDLNLKRMRMVGYGSKDRGGYSYFTVSVPHATGTWSSYAGGITDGRDFQRLYWEQEWRILPEANMMIGEILRYTSTSWNQTNGTWTTANGANNIGHTMQMLKDMTKFTRIAGNVYLSNDYVIEIYDLGNGEL